MTAGFVVRRATLADVHIIARHRAEMFTDMGQLPPALREPLVAAAVQYLEVAVPAAEYVGWLATPAASPEQIVAGAGVQVRRVLPHPLVLPDAITLANGRQGIVLNVFTERAWRRRGLAALLMDEVLSWARASGLDTLVLHASGEGRPLYERLGFAPTNEMRFAGTLS